MKAASVKELKEELSHRSQSELLDICLRLSRFKKENKELLTYLLIESENETHYVQSIKAEIDEQFELINRKNYYFIKKSIRKILKSIKKYARYSDHKETEIELLVYFCKKLVEFRPSIKKNKVLQGIFDRQLSLTKRLTSKLHEDLQYDYQVEINELTKR